MVISFFLRVITLDRVLLEKVLVTVIMASLKEVALDIVGMTELDKDERMVWIISLSCRCPNAYSGLGTICFASLVMVRGGQG